MDYWRDKVVLVTGGSAGLGLAICQFLGAAGARIIAVARDEQRLAEVEKAAHEAGWSLRAEPTDVTQEESVKQLVAGVQQREGRLDALVNCAGRSTRGEAYRTPPAEFQALWELNFLAVARCVYHAAPHLMEAKGHIVNIGSLASKSAAPNLGAYSASKFPLAGYSQQLRLELEPHGVHVLLVCPGPLKRADAGQRYQEQAEGLPEAARQPGGGVRLRGLDVAKVAAAIARACERRQPELVLPARAKLLFALSQLSPSWGDWLLKKMMNKNKSDH